MPSYTEKNMLRVAKRYQNTKRTYLLVNPLQAKHLPVSPSDALEMMKALGDLLRQKYSHVGLVIGFAETATAIGAAVASCFSPQCIYLHTTRESMPEVHNWIEFSEEHSHAVEQRLCAENLFAWFHNSETIIFVEDEISTGKTMINMIEKLKLQFPCLSEKTLVAASLLNRVSNENLRKMKDAGITCEYLVKLPQVDYTAAVKDIEVSEAMPVQTVEQHLTCDTFLDPGMEFTTPRTGIAIASYCQSCNQIAQEFISRYEGYLHHCRSILVLGTEECMYPALILGSRLEEHHRQLTVRCHATTRSPIGISDAKEYPVISGNKLISFYSSERDTYIYNLAHYDAVIVVTDDLGGNLQAMNSLAAAMQPHPSHTVFCIQGGRNVWHISEK